MLKLLLTGIDLHMQAVLGRRYGTREAIAVGAIRIVALIEVQQYLIVLYIIQAQVYVPTAAIGLVIVGLVIKRYEQFVLVLAAIQHIHTLVHMQLQRCAIYAKAKDAIFLKRLLLAAVGIH